MKKYLTLFLAFTLYFNCFTSAYASNSMGGWTLSNPIAQGASTIYQGAKNVIINGKNVAKTSTALITPVAKDVSKVLVRGVAGVALSFAVEQLLGKVDWVLDPANNRITYYQNPETCTSSNCSSFKKIWLMYSSSGQISGQSPEAICRLYLSKYSFPGSEGFTFLKVTDYNENAKVCHGTDNRYPTLPNMNVSETIFYVDNPSYNPQSENEQKTLPLDVVAQKVIDNAENGNSDAKVVTTAAAADIVNDAQNDDAKARPIVNQLESNSKTEADNTATGETKPNTETGGTDLSLEFPTFCGWAPQVCEAAQTVISLPTLLKEWVNAVQVAWADFWKEPNLEKENSDFQIDDKQVEDVSTFDRDYLNFGGQCPAMEQASITVGPITVPISFDVTAFCDWAVILRPAILALAYLSALAIVSSAIRDS